jgi:lysophospholipase L1-like esterase
MLHHALRCFAAAVWFLAVTQAARAEPIRIVTLGDSITKGVRPGVSPEQTFSAHLEKTLRQQGLQVSVANAGIGGETTAGALNRLAKTVLNAQPHLVTVMYGTNDCYVDPGKKESRLSAERFKENLVEIVGQLAKAGVETVLMTEPAYAENGPKNGIGEDCNVRLGAYMALTRAIAKERKLPLVDHFGHWLAQRKKGLKLAPWTTDGYHPNPRGHEDMAHRIAQVVLPLAQRLADKFRLGTRRRRTACSSTRCPTATTARCAGSTRAPARCRARWRAIRRRWC